MFLLFSMLSSTTYIYICYFSGSGFSPTHKYIMEGVRIYFYVSSNFPSVVKFQGYILIYRIKLIDIMDHFVLLCLSVNKTMQNLIKFCYSCMLSQLYFFVKMDMKFGCNMRRVSAPTWELLLLFTVLKSTNQM